MLAYNVLFGLDFTSSLDMGVNDVISPIVPLYVPQPILLPSTEHCFAVDFLLFSLFYNNLRLEAYLKKFLLLSYISSATPRWPLFTLLKSIRIVNENCSLKIVVRM